jgi:hypothetical protein
VVVLVGDIFPLSFGLHKKKRGERNACARGKERCGPGRGDKEGQVRARLVEGKDHGSGEKSSRSYREEEKTTERLLHAEEVRAKKGGRAGKMGRCGAGLGRREKKGEGRGEMGQRERGAWIG